MATVQQDVQAHPSVEERVERGRAARAEVPRSSHAEFVPAATRPDPVALLEQEGLTRLPELLPIRYGRMLASPFAYLRGCAAAMAADLATTPRTGIQAQLCGDAHLANFGFFGTPERRLVFDLNDFDETLPGPWEWDVKRLAASLAVLGRERGFTPAERAAVVTGTAEQYRLAMRSFAEMRNLDVWYASIDVDEAIAELRGEFAPKNYQRLEREVAKARTRDSLREFGKLTEVVDGERRIVSRPPLIVPIEELLGDVDREQAEAMLDAALDSYRNSLDDDRRHLLGQYRVAHVARKVVGVGSVGARAWIVLLLGRDSEDPLFLQVKEAGPSVLEDYLAPSEHDSAGKRVVAGQRLMQSSSDLLLGWRRGPGLDAQERDFYFRQLKDWKGSVNVEKSVPRGLEAYGRHCGWTLARAHARTGDRIAIAAYLGKSDTFDSAIAQFAESYADQNEADFALLQAAVADGRVSAQTGV